MMFFVCTAVLVLLTPGPAFAKGWIATDVSQKDPNSACASCHREIYERYRETPMANASAHATAEGVPPADFTHAASGIHYRVFAEDGKVWLSYEREHAPASRVLSGKQQLQYVIGSGHRGKTFLFEQGGYWFEAPINWYGKKQVWGMAPNYQSAEEMPLTLPVDPGCLYCHASQVAEALPDARNLYASAPFAAPGMNLAIVDCAEGKKAEALETLDRLLIFSPDNQKARSLSLNLRSGSQSCGRKN